MDFSIEIYKKLLTSLKSENFKFLKFNEFVKENNEKSLVLRHDVDLLPENSLRFAKIQAEMKIQGTYFFRAVPESWDVTIIKEIASLGHEIGYHYETMDTAMGNIDNAWDQFCLHLENLRKIAEVNTVCMHGSPRSHFDNRALWEKYDYRSLGLIGEPYLDVNFNETLYLTDTGRRWDGYKVSIRDKIPIHQERWNKEGLIFHSTEDIINRVNELPNRIMFTFHPQRWHDRYPGWLKELLVQKLKNTIKFIKIKIS